MSNFNINRFGQESGAGDVRALFAELYANQVKAVYETPLVAGQFTSTMSESGGKTWHYPFRSRADAIEHEPGTEIEGSNAPITTERTISADQKELLSRVTYSSVDLKVSNLDNIFSHDAMQTAYAVRRKIEDRIFRMCALGARQAEAGSGDTKFEGGNLVWRDAASLAAAYPVSVQGARNLTRDLEDMMQKFREKDVPSNRYVCVMTPYLMKVLLQDPKLTSADWTGISRNSYLDHRIFDVAGFTVVSSNLLPTNNLTTGETAYRINCSQTAALFFANPESVYHIQFGGLEVEGPTWYQNKRSWLLTAASLNGIKWMRPEACGELHVGSSDYTLSNGVYSPA